MFQGVSGVVLAVVVVIVLTSVVKTNIMPELQAKAANSEAANCDNSLSIINIMIHFTGILHYLREYINNQPID